MIANFMLPRWPLPWLVERAFSLWIEPLGQMSAAFGFQKIRKRKIE
jgi:hypothetical protein